MDSPIDHQLHQVHSTYAAMIPKLVKALVESGALPAGLATLLLRQAAQTLQNGPAQGHVVMLGVHDLSSLAQAIEATASQAP